MQFCARCCAVVSHLLVRKRSEFQVSRTSTIHAVEWTPRLLFLYGPERPAFQHYFCTGVLELERIMILSERKIIIRSTVKPHKR